VVAEAVMVAGVLLLPVPALVLGVRRVRDRPERSSLSERVDRVELALLVLGRLLGLLLLLVLSGVTLLACIGGLVRDRTLPSLVYVFFAADLLVAALLLLISGRRGRRPARRSASPARR
jgi:hypothetical protein